MPRDYSLAGVELNVNPLQQGARDASRPEPDEPFRVLILGNFSGAGTGGPKPLRIDRDNFDDVVRALGLHLEFALSNGQLGDSDLKFEGLEDFEPDSIYQRSELFGHLNGKEERYPHPERVTEPAVIWERDDMNRLAARGSLLDAVVEKSADPSYEFNWSADPLKETINRITAPYVVPKESADSVKASADRVTRASMVMRSILHDPRFQALEAAWRGLDFLVRNLESDASIKLFLFDISQERMAADLLAAPSIAQSETYKAVMQSARSEPWAMMAGLHVFDRAVMQDVRVLAGMGEIAQAAGAPFVAECVPSQREDAEAQAAWRTLRRSAIAPWLGLAMPRFLLRLPYGRAATTIDSFDFEEVQGQPRHPEYLWGNPALACVFLMARAFSAGGWDFHVQANERIEGLPLHVFKVGGETRVQPCAEVLLSDQDCEALLGEGLMPLASVKDGDSVRFPGVQSIAEPTAALAGMWVK